MTHNGAAQDPVRVAGVGAGYFSQFHYQSWARMERVQLVGACDQDLSKARATGLPAFDALARMIHDTSPDLLDVILPPAAQAQAIDIALEAGVRWLICQKPFCTGLKEAQRVAEAAQACGATLIIHENFRFQPWYRRIRQALDAGEIGQLQQVTFRMRPGDGQGPQAYLDRQPYFQKMPRFLVHETAVHWVDTFRFLLGDPVSVYADLRRLNPDIAGEDAGHILFDYPNGVRALYDGNRHLDHSSDNLRRTMGEALLEGTQGVLRLHGDGAVTLRRFGEQTEVSLLAPDRWDGFGGDCVHTLQCHVIAAMLDGTAIENRAEAYLGVLAIEEAIYASDQAGAKQVLAL